METISNIVLAIFSLPSSDFSQGRSGEVQGAVSILLVAPSTQ